MSQNRQLVNRPFFDGSGLTEIFTMAAIVPVYMTDVCTSRQALRQRGECEAFLVCVSNKQKLPRLLPKTNEWDHFFDHVTHV